MAAPSLPDVSHLFWLAWLTTLARAFVLPVLGCALVLRVAPRLPAWMRRLGPLLLRASLVLLVLAAYGPVAGELAASGPVDAPLYRVASLVVLVCALALVIVLPLLAEGLGTPRPAAPPRPAPPPLPSTPRAEVMTRAAPRVPRSPVLEDRLPPAPCPPYPGRPLAPRSVYPSTAFAAKLVRPRVTPSPALPFVTAEVLAPRMAATRPGLEAEAARTLDQDAAPARTAARAPLATDLRAAVRTPFAPPPIAPIRPDETVRVPTPLPRPRPAAPVEPLPPTHPMTPSSQARLVAATALPRITPVQVRTRRALASTLTE